MFKADYIEWNDPFDGCTDREQLLLELQREYNDNAFYDQRKKGLQARVDLGTYQEEDSRKGQGTKERGPVYGR